MDLEINPPDGYFAPAFNWDVKRTSVKLLLDKQGLVCSVKQGTGFKSTLGSLVFTPGDRYYFQIYINKGQLIKIGVCRPQINIDEAFSDTIKGWGIYNGELRHNSNSTGTKYGTSLNTGDLVGVGLDMIQGTLTFYKNNVSWGVAFKDEELKKGELVAAVAPIYQNDQFTLKCLMKED